MHQLKLRFIPDRRLVLLLQILPVSIKGLAGSVATLANWLTSWVITLTANLLLDWSSGGLALSPPPPISCSPFLHLSWNLKGCFAYCCRDLHPVHSCQRLDCSVCREAGSGDEGQDPGGDPMVLPMSPLSAMSGRGSSAGEEQSRAERSGADQSPPICRRRVVAGMRDYSFISSAFRAHERRPSFVPQTAPACHGVCYHTGLSPPQD